MLHGQQAACTHRNSNRSGFFWSKKLTLCVWPYSQRCDYVAGAGLLYFIHLSRCVIRQFLVFQRLLHAFDPKFTHPHLLTPILGIALHKFAFIYYGAFRTSGEMGFFFAGYRGFQDPGEQVLKVRKHDVRWRTRKPKAGNTGISRQVIK